MAKHWTDLFSYVTGAIRYNDLGYMVMTFDAAEEMTIPSSSIVQWEPEGWGDGGQVKWRTAGVAIAKHPLEQCIIVGEFGNVLLAGNGDRHEETIKTDNTSPADKGPLRGVRCMIIKYLLLVWSIGAKDVMCFDANSWTRVD
jgi:hypothetical protein